MFGISTGALSNNSTGVRENCPCLRSVNTLAVRFIGTQVHRAPCKVAGHWLRRSGAFGRTL